MLKFLRKHGFSGAVYPVNPKYGEVQGLRCYPSLEAIPEPVDVAVVVVPARAVEPMFAALPRDHVKFALMVSAGFAEAGPGGEALQRRMLAAARAKGVRVVGPNAVGSINAWDGVVATISQYVDRERMEPGPIALVSQSGAFGTALLAQADREGALVRLLRELGERGGPGVLRLRPLPRRARSGADRVRLSGGDAGREGLRRVRSTGASAGQARRRAQGGLHQGGRGRRPLPHRCAGRVGLGGAGGVRRLRRVAGPPTASISWISSRSSPGRRRARGKRLAILSHSGGAGVMAADAAAACGADVAPLSDGLRGRLEKMLPRVATVDNPLDMTGGASLQAGLMADCLRVMLEDDGYDAAVLCVNLIWRQGMALLDELEDIARTAGKPFAVSWVAPSEEAARAQVRARFPVFGDPARAARMMSERLRFDARRRARAADGTDAPTHRRSRPDRELPLNTVAEQAELLRAYGVRLPAAILARSAEAAEGVPGPRERHGRSEDRFPRHHAPHRNRRRGHRRSRRLRARRRLRDSAGPREETRPRRPHRRRAGAGDDRRRRGDESSASSETRCSGRWSCSGAGGMLVELMRDVQLRPAPLARAQAFEMIERSAVHPLLAGYRGGPALDVAALAETLVRVSRLAVDYPEIQELDLNPVMVMPAGQGCFSVDCKLVVSSE